MAIYERFKGKAYDEETLWDAVFLQDIRALEAAGIEHGDFGEVKVFLNKE